MSDTRPNILVIMSDQQRYDTLGCYGSQVVPTPNLDGLASGGVLFEQCYVNNPLCTPSRASMLTGKHLPGHGVYQLHDNLPEDELLFPQHLQTLGYHTSLFGKLHVSAHPTEAAGQHPNDGFDVYEMCHEQSFHMDVDFNGYARWLEAEHPQFYERMYELGRGVGHLPLESHMTRWAAMRTADRIRSWDGDAPFFAMMSVFDPHNPYDDYPVEMRELVDEEMIADPVTFDGELEGFPPVLRRVVEGTGPLGHTSMTYEQIKEHRTGYFASIALIDIEVGRVLKALDDRGIAGNTLVIFVSDHGDMLGDHRLVIKGGFFYDPCVRVPFMMRWPARLGEYIRAPHLVQPHDIAATCLAAAGADSDVLDTMPDSIDLASVIVDGAGNARDAAVCVYRNSGLYNGSRTDTPYFDPPVNATMLRNERYKLNVYHNPQPGGGSQGQLFDMTEDPLECRDLWNDPSSLEIKNRLMASLVDWLAGQEIRGLGSRGGEMLTG